MNKKSESVPSTLATLLFCHVEDIHLAKPPLTYVTKDVLLLLGFYDTILLPFLRCGLISLCQSSKSSQFSELGLGLLICK